MSLNKRIDELENRTPKNMLKWDGRPETAEAFVRAYISLQNGCGPENSDQLFAEYDADDPQTYVEQIMAQ